MTRFEARFLNGTGIYNAHTGNKISGTGPTNLPTWQRPMPPAMLLPTAARVMAPALGPLLRPGA